MHSHRYFMHLLSFTVLLLVNCKSSLRNNINDIHFMCGEGYEEGKSYIKISNGEGLVSFSPNTNITANGCVERPIKGQIFVSNASRTLGVWLNPESKSEVSLEPLAPNQLPTTEVSMKLPDFLAPYKSETTFSLVNSSIEPKVIKGTDFKVDIPLGTYIVDLVLRDKLGNEYFRSCESQKTFSFYNSKEDLIIDICRSTDRTLIGKSLETTVKTISNPTPNADDTANSRPASPLFIETTKCFGFPATTSREGTEVVIKITGSFKDYTFVDYNFPKCILKFNAPKKVGEGFTPLNYKVSYTADEETLAQLYFLSVRGKTESGDLATPCKPLIFNTNDNSLKPYQCSIYDTTAALRYTILDRYKEPYQTLCKSQSQEFQLEIEFIGTVDTTIKEMTIPEIRVQIPYTETCV